MKATRVGRPVMTIFGVLWSLLGAVGLTMVGLDALKGLRLDGTTASLAIGAVYFGFCLTGGVHLLRKSSGSRVVLLTCATIQIIYSVLFLALVGVEFGAVWTLALGGSLFGVLSIVYLRRTEETRAPPA